MPGQFSVAMRLAASAAIMTLFITLAAAYKTAQAQKRLRGVQYVNAETAPDAALERAILKTIPDYKPESSADEVGYYYNRVDLNGDGKPEVIAHITGRYVCGTGGCDTLIFQPAKGGYRLVSTITLSRTPVIVSPTKTRGWNDLIMYVVGGGITRGYYVTLRFNGRTYPEDPTDLPQMNSRARISGKAYIANEDMSAGTGITLKRAQP
ncbi:MAG TPA: hypothetical protein VF708_11870 [Pyrinomonadaceae bacterium]